MPVYIFLDEGGDFNFSPTGSKYFSLTCVNMARPFKLHTELDTYKYDLIEYLKTPRINLEHFHCADDNKYIRKRMFDLLATELPQNCVDSVIVEKSKTGTALQAPDKFYPKMIGYLLKFAVNVTGTPIDEVIVITDNIPINKKRNAIEKGIKLLLARILPKGTPYQIMHHASKAHYGLQIADYLNWAMFRKWEHGDDDAYKIVKHLFRSEFDIFRTGKRHYY